MRVAWRYEAAEGMAAEYVNLAFYKILQKLDQYNENVPFEAWIRRIMINTVIDEYRKDKKYKEIFVKKEFETLEADDKREIDLYQLDSKLGVEEIAGLLKSLPEATARVFNLFVFDDYSHKEIAELLGISEGTSKWHVATAKKLLKEKLIQLPEYQQTSTQK